MALLLRVNEILSFVQLSFVGKIWEENGVNFSSCFLIKYIQFLFVYFSGGDELGLLFSYYLPSTLAASKTKPDDSFRYIQDIQTKLTCSNF
jgi:hypothetical protein